MRDTAVWSPNGDAWLKPGVGGSDARNTGNALDVTVVLVVSAVFAALGALVFFALMLWAAREDGRDQRARDARSR
jgi:hypothetical protein